MNNIPMEWDQIDALVSKFSPSTVHCKNTGLTRYFSWYLLKQVISCYKIKLPKEWDPDFFRLCLFVAGFVCIFRHDRYGVIPQPATLSGYNLFYQPANVIITNPLFTQDEKRKIGTDCVIIKLQLDYKGIMPIVGLYADLMALATEAAGVNLVNSKFAYLFATKNKAGAESWKKIFDEIQAGNPAAFFDKNLLNEDGTPNWHLFNREVGSSYITDKILIDLKRIEHDFDEAVGIPSTNTEKRERLNTLEVNASAYSTKCLPREVVRCVNRGFEQAREMFGVDCSLEYNEESEGANNDINS